MFNEKGNYQYPGDMVRSTYDSNNDGVVNAADSVPWSGVTNTPDTLSGYGIEDVPASVLSGVIGIEHIPPSAVERMKIVENDSMRFALTTADVQNGDTVKVTATGKMYLVVDDGNLDSESGYAVYVAGRAAAVDWTGVENKPETIENIDDILDTSEEESEEGNPVTFETESAQMAKSTKLTFAPIQDLHGYDHPWPAGGGKNLLPMTVDSIKQDNGGANSWTGNTKVIGNITYTLLTDDGNNVIGIRANGTSNASFDYLYLSKSFNAVSGTEYTISGSPSGASPSTFRIFTDSSSAFPNGNRLSDDTENDKTRTAAGSETCQVFIQVLNGTVLDNVVFYPMIRLASVSDATFEPYSNICPISGRTGVTVTRTGKNLWGGEKLANDILRLVSDSRIDQVYNSVYFTAQNVDGIDLFSNFKTDTQYTFILRGMNNSLSAKDVNLKVVYTDGTSEKLSFATAGVESYCSFTSAYNKSIKALMGIWQTSSTKLYYNKCGIFEGVLTEADFEPYQGQSVTVQLGQTVYGGTLDVTQGVLTANRAIVDLGTLDYTYQALSGPRSAFSVSISSLKPASGGWDFLPAISAIYSAKRYNDPWEDGDMSYFSSSGQNISFINNAYTDAASFKTAMDGVQLCYELATPITYTLTPQQLALFKGMNVISTNAKTVQITYRNGELATTENIVDVVEVAKQNAIGESASYTDARLATELAPILGDLATAETSPASASHAVGEYLLYNNRLYKVLAAISAGQQLTIGTNIGQTNVAAELASQANSIGFLKGLTSATAGFHNGIYRGKNISSYLTDGTLWKRINGSDGYELFEDLYIGDYIVVNGRSYTIVDFDYYIRTGSVDLNVHHLVMMPTGNMNIPAGTVLYGIVPEETLTFINTVNAGIDVSSQESATAFKWNATMEAPNTHTTAGGYKYSRMRRVIMKAAETLVINDFGSSHVNPITVLYHNPASESASGVANTWTWFNADDRSDPLCKSICDLPNETQVYGQQVWGRGSAYTNVGYEVGVDKWQFAIFALQRNFANIRSYWWLRSVSSASGAAYVDSIGHADNNGSAYAFGVRPRFILVG